MRRSRLGAVALVLILSVAGAGCSALTGDQSPTNTPAPETTSSPTATTTATPSTPRPNTTTPPAENTTGTPDTRNNTNGSEGSLPEYAAMMSEILHSDDTQMSSLDTPLPENNTLHSGMVEIKSIETEEYASGTDNDTRLRVEYYNTDDQGDGLNEIRVISIAYTHAMNRSLKNDETIVFDEVDIVSYQNESSTQPSARLKIDEAWVLYYATNSWDGGSLVKTTTATAGGYINQSFGDYPTEFEQRLEQNSPENVSILRVEEYGAIVFVDYATSTPPEMTEKRAHEIARMVELYGRSSSNHDFSSQNDVFNGNNSTGASNMFLEERYNSISSMNDLRTWHMYYANESMKIAADNMSDTQIFSLIESEITYEKDNLGK